MRYKQTITLTIIGYYANAKYII